MYDPHDALLSGTQLKDRDSFPNGRKVFPALILVLVLVGVAIWLL